MVFRFEDVGVGGEESGYMAAFAAMRNILMKRRQERCRGEDNGRVVTRAAIILGRNVVNALGRRDSCAVAGRAIIRVYSQVAESDAPKTCEVVDIVTRRAIQRRGHVIRRFPDTDSGVMAGAAIVYIDAHVIERRAGEVDGVMADGAIRRRRQVVDELADADHIVMA